MWSRQHAQIMCFLIARVMQRPFCLSKNRDPSFNLRNLKTEQNSVEKSGAPKPTQIRLYLTNQERESGESRKERRNTTLLSNQGLSEMQILASSTGNLENSSNNLQSDVLEVEKLVNRFLSFVLF